MCYCDDASVAGTPFYLMEYVEGRIFWTPALPGLTPPERAAIYEEMNRVIAAIHAIDPDAVGLADFGRRENYVARQIERWSKQYRASELERIESMEQLIDWLPRARAARRARAHHAWRLPHRQSHLRPPRAPHPRGHRLGTRDARQRALGLRVQLHAVPHARAVRKGLAGLDLAQLGIPSEQEYVGKYLERTGRSAEPTSTFDFYIAFNLFRLASILQGVAARARLGNASSEHATEAGSLTRPIADLGWAQARRVH